MPGIPRHIARCCLFSAALSTTAGAAASDTAKVYRYDEVVVSSERYPESAERAGAVSYDLAWDPSWEFSGAGPVLGAGRGLHLVSYGGGMALQTLSVRGMGAEHTLVLWNGMPAGNMQTGVSDLNLFDASGLSGIRVVPGGAGAIHGTAAVGGVVNLLPASPLDGPASVEAGGSFGSFGATGAYGRATFRPSAATGISVRAATGHGDGRYPFADPATGATVVREGSDYDSRSLSLSAASAVGTGGRLGLTASALSLEQGSPGPWMGAPAAPAARRRDERLLAGVSYERPDERGTSVSASSLVDLQYERYLDPSGAVPADNFYRTTWAGGSARMRHRAGGDWLLLGGAEGRYERAAGNAIDETRERAGGALTASASWMTSLAAGEVTFTGSLRGEAVTTFRPAFTPRLGLNAEWTAGETGIRAHASAAGAHRNPTMNELWYAGEGGRGNPGLGPETATSIDAGVGGTLPLAGELTLDATWYRIGMDDRIQWLPTSNPRIWSPVNIGRTRSTGWEFGAVWAIIPGELEINADYAVIDSKRGTPMPDGTISYERQLMYVPLDKGSAGFLVGRGNVAPWLRSVQLTGRVVGTGVRYTADDLSTALPATAIFDAGAQAVVSAPGGAATIVYRAGNLTGVDYEVMPGYPMPRFHQDLSLHWNVEL